MDQQRMTFGLYNEAGERVRDYPVDPDVVYRVDDIMSETFWTDDSVLVEPPPDYREYLYSKLHVRPDGVSEYQVRERGVHSAADPGECVVSRHGSYPGARKAVRAAVEDFKRVNVGGYGYCWLITDQDGRELTPPNFERWG